MTKTSKASQYGISGTSKPVTVVRNPKTGKLVTVKGVGALKDASPEIAAGVNLAEPIAKQAFSARNRKAR